MQPLDATTYIGVVVLVALTAVVSMAPPAWRAARVDPAVALRNEQDAASSSIGTRRARHGTVLKPMEEFTDEAS